MKILSTTNDSTGEHHHLDRGELDLVAIQIVIIENSARFSSVVHPTQSSGSQSTLLWTESRFAGAESSDWQDGIPISSCGEYTMPHTAIVRLCFIMLSNVQCCLSIESEKN